MWWDYNGSHFFNFGDIINPFRIRLQTYKLRFSTRGIYPKTPQHRFILNLAKVSEFYVWKCAKIVLAPISSILEISQIPPGFVQNYTNADSLRGGFTRKRFKPEKSGASPAKGEYSVHNHQRFSSKRFDCFWKLFKCVWYHTVDRSFASPHLSRRLGSVEDEITGFCLAQKALGDNLGHKESLRP